MTIAVPAAIGPLPLEQRTDHRLDLARRRPTQGASRLPRRCPPGDVCRRQRPPIRPPGAGRPPGVSHASTCSTMGTSRGLIDGNAQLDERHQSPVRSRPLLVGMLNKHLVGMIATQQPVHQRALSAPLHRAPHPRDHASPTPGLQVRGELRAASRRRHGYARRSRQESGRGSRAQTPGPGPSPGSGSSLTH